MTKLTTAAINQAYNKYFKIEGTSQKVFEAAWVSISTLYPNEDTSFVIEKALNKFNRVSI